MVGFCYDTDAQHVLLVRKTRPTWQAGLLNGVGGKVEPGEHFQAAMVREWVEETPAAPVVPTWEHFVTLLSGEHTIVFFRAFTHWEDLAALHRTVNDVGERLFLVRIESVVANPHVPNLSWLVPLGAYTHDTYAPLVCRETTPRT